MKRPLCYFCLAYVIAVFIYFQIYPPSSSITVEEGEYQVYYGTVYQKEISKDQYIVYLKDVESSSYQFESEQKISKKDIRIICYMEDSRIPPIGSRIKVTGKSRNFKLPRNQGGFNEKSYYAIRKIAFALDKAQMTECSKSYHHNKEFLFQLRSIFAKELDMCMRQTDSSVMKAVLLGMKKDLDPAYKNLFEQSGISHIFAISGLHISILGMGFYKILEKWKIPMKWRIITTVIFMLQYGQMVGMTSSSIRAIFMFSLHIGSFYVKRTYDMLTALALTAVSILIEQPLYLFDAGFLLSFSAVLGIGIFYPYWKVPGSQQSDKTNNEKNIRLKKFGPYIKDSFLASFTIMLVQLPIMLTFFYSFSVYSIVINLLILPVIPVLLILGIVCLFLESLYFFMPFMKMLSALSNIAGFLCHELLQLFRQICETSLSLPYASWIIGKPKKEQIIIYYTILLILLAGNIYAAKVKKGYSTLSGIYQIIIIFIAFSCLFQKDMSGLRIDMLDVGQGDCIFIETEQGKHFLIDCGSTSKKQIGKYTLVPFLKYNGVHKLEQIFITHLDEDHISGILELLDNDVGIRIGQINLAKAVIKDEKYQELIQKCLYKNIKIEYLETGDIFEEGKMKLKILHPEGDFPAQDTNAYSLILQLEYESFHALFTGDATEEGELLAQQQLKDWKCNLFKVTHHGSSYSNTQSLLETIRPEAAIISCGKNNSYGHPHKETLERLENVDSKIFRTDDSGEITIRVGENKYTVQTYLTF